jgi:DNA repair protein RecN (Recombination protein N)
MLHELSISQLGVIEAARVSLGAGLTVVTGETGAGKTMILTGLSLILGGKPTPDAVRTGASEASAEAVIDLPAPSRVRGLAEEAGATIDDDGTVTVVRTVGAASRSRSILGGRTVPQALLAELGDELVTVHGQSDQVRLRTPAKQRETLDAYAGAAHAHLLRAYREAWAAWREAADRLARLERSEDAERERVGRLRADLDALETVDVQLGEKADLVAEAEVLSHAESLRVDAALAHEALAGDEGVTAATALEAARRALADGGAHDPALQALAVRVADFAYGAADVAQELASYLDRLDADPSRLDAINARLSALGAAERRFACTADELVSLRERLERELGEGADWEELVGNARAIEAAARHDMTETAAAVTAGRLEAAQGLSAQVGKELAALAMPDATVEVRVTASEPGPHGADDIAWLLSAHPGAPARPIGEAASGGELSRIMLAVEVSLAGAGGPARTFVFDEVDAGVGGKAAQSVGQRLAALSRSHQVIAVTHLAQVAAWADRHVVVTKASDGAVTVSQVVEVTGDDRVREVARLLSGEQDSASARAHALELIEAARVAP